MPKRFFAAALLLLTGWVAWSPSVTTAAAAEDLSDEQVAMGMPSDAKDQKNDFLMRKNYFVLSYNNKKGTPNWVSWHLAKKYIGIIPRGDFHPDDTLPDGFKKITPRDYTKSGFDRGHMCPHSDRSKTREMSEATFVMTNMVPQSPENNQKAWNQLEIYCRTLVEKKGKECYIASGPAGVGGTGRNGKMTSVPNGKVVVPAFTWKVVLVVPAGTTDPADVKGANARLIAVVVPNDRTPTLDWASHRVSVEEVEDLTDLKFFDKVKDPAFVDKKAEVDQIPIGPPLPVANDD